MLTTNHEHVRRLTKSYPSLPGLMLVPYGVYFLILGIWQGLHAPALLFLPARYVFVVLVLGAYGLAVLGAYAIARYYYQPTFGRVRPQPATERWNVIGAIIVVLTIFASVVIQNAFRPPLGVTALDIGGLLVLLWGITDRMRIHYLVLGIVIMGAGLSPLINPAYNVLQIGADGNPALMLVAGAVCIIGGIGDHLLLLHQFRAVAKEE